MPGKKKMQVFQDEVEERAQKLPTQVEDEEKHHRHTKGAIWQRQRPDCRESSKMLEGQSW